MRAGSNVPFSGGGERPVIRARDQANVAASVWTGVKLRTRTTDTDYGDWRDSERARRSRKFAAAMAWIVWAL
jgi:hypothetical protein